MKRRLAGHEHDHARDACPVERKHYDSRRRRGLWGLLGHRAILPRHSPPSGRAGSVRGQRETQREKAASGVDHPLNRFLAGGSPGRGARERREGKNTPHRSGRAPAHTRSRAPGLRAEGPERDMAKEQAGQVGLPLNHDLGGRGLRRGARRVTPRKSLPTSQAQQIARLKRLPLLGRRLLPPRSGPPR